MHTHVKKEITRSGDPLHYRSIRHLDSWRGITITQRITRKYQYISPRYHQNVTTEGTNTYQRGAGLTYIAGTGLHSLSHQYGTNTSTRRNHQNYQHVLTWGVASGRSHWSESATRVPSS